MVQRNNVLIIYADQWRAQTCGYMGCRDVQTPNLDQLAAESVNCRYAVSGTPVCTPARASLLTGLYPHKHGLFLNDVPLDPHLPTLGKVFSSSGYRTGWVGKWHVDGHGRYSYVPPERRQGFEYFKALECTHAYQHSRYYDNNDTAQRVWGGYDAFAQTEDLLAWLAHDDGRPFFAVLSWGPPHSPYDTAPAACKARYEARNLELPPNVPDAQRTEATRAILAGYYAHCTALDTALGRLRAALAEQGLAERTLLLFTADHGDFLGAHGLWDKQGPWDEAIRVPFLIHTPGLQAAVNDTVIDHPDILPTLCGMTGLTPPATVQGRDLSTHLRLGTVPEGNLALLAGYHNFGNWPGIAAQGPELYRAREFRGVRTVRYTYVEEHTKPWLLYDNENDPYQMQNLVEDLGAAEIRRKLAESMRRKMAEVGDTFEQGWDMVRKWDYHVGADGTMPIQNWHG